MDEKLKVLIAYDGSDCARVALKDLGRAGLPDDVTALAVTVTEVTPPHPPPSGSGETEMVLESGKVKTALAKAYEHAMKARSDALALADIAAETVKVMFPAWEAGAEALSGAPAWEIISKAEEWGADLIVVGSHGRSALGRLILGSVSRKVANEARCSVRVARCIEQRGDPPVKIIVGTDGSPGAGDAVRSVAARRWPGGSEVRIVTSIKPYHMYGTPPETQSALVQDIQNGAEEQLRGAGISITKVVREGEAKEVLIGEAKAWGADCVFVGSRGLGDGLTRYLLGSVSNALVKDAPCSVEVVRP
ncbi:MAG: universal stress protein [Acidobacteriota bacterium]|nr:universal stress protein [Acidobacteriota bacterium]